jgi:hypothetical protein
VDAEPTTRFDHVKGVSDAYTHELPHPGREVSGPDGRPLQLHVPGLAGADFYRLPDFLANCEAVVMGRTTFLPALTAPRWAWRQPVVVPSSRALPAGHAGRGHPTVERGRTGRADADRRHQQRRSPRRGAGHHAGVPRDRRARRALATSRADRPRRWSSARTSRHGPLSLSLGSTWTFEDGVIELPYALQQSAAPLAAGEGNGKGGHRRLGFSHGDETRVPRIQR